MEQQVFENEVTEKKTYPMKWHKAVLVFLWIGIVLNLISSVMYFMGTQYQEFTYKVYKMLPALRGMDIFSGIFAIGMAAFGFITWLRLKNYKKHAPKLLIAMYVANMLFYIVYMFAFYMIISGAETKIIYGNSYIQGSFKYQRYLDLNKVAFSATDIVPIIVSIVMIVIDSIYYKKRAELFVY